MTAQEIRETLEKQLQLLSERSQKADIESQVNLTHAMVILAEQITSIATGE